MNSEQRVKQLEAHRRAAIKALTPIMVKTEGGIKFVSADPETVVATVRECDALLGRLTEQLRSLQPITICKLPERPEDEQVH